MHTVWLVYISFYFLYMCVCPKLSPAKVEDIHIHGMNEGRHFARTSVNWILTLAMTKWIGAHTHQGSDLEKNENFPSISSIVFEWPNSSRFAFIASSFILHSCFKEPEHAKPFNKRTIYMYVCIRYCLDYLDHHHRDYFHPSPSSSRLCSKYSHPFFPTPSVLRCMLTNKMKTLFLLLYFPSTTQHFLYSTLRIKWKTEDMQAEKSEIYS